MSDSNRSFTLTFSIEGAAFGDNAVPEIQRILRQTIEQVEEYGDLTCRVRDVNGNRVGFWTFEEVAQ